jgi:hypothetical protein
MQAFLPDIKVFSRCKLTQRMAEVKVIAQLPITYKDLIFIILLEQAKLSHSAPAICFELYNDQQDSKQQKLSWLWCS